MNNISRFITILGKHKLEKREGDWVRERKRKRKDFLKQWSLSNYYFVFTDHKTMSWGWTGLSLLSVLCVRVCVWMVRPQSCAGSSERSYSGFESQSIQVEGLLFSCSSKLTLVQVHQGLSYLHVHSMYEDHCSR